jgi:hypothetical protein
MVIHDLATLTTPHAMNKSGNLIFVDNELSAELSMKNRSLHELEFGCKRAGLGLLNTRLSRFLRSPVYQSVSGRAQTRPTTCHRNKPDTNKQRWLCS